MPFDDSGDISLEIKTFIKKYIHSVTLLDVLFLLKSSEERSWTPEEVSLEMRSNPGYARSQLLELVTMNMLAEKDGRFRYETQELGDLADKLEILYNTRRSTITNFIYSQPIESIRGFANAFKIKKD
ncbi:hypothetical protein ACLVWU_07725 [Bdellovibrio sp. HCB290]|uniref:hypothetical protein n=1 Tax=Bdellovibrio sp. HCB290 TaxID=3394356 RepID=UPI0039B3F779